MKLEYFSWKYEGIRTSWAIAYRTLSFSFLIFFFFFRLLPPTLQRFYYIVVLHKILQEFFLKKKINKKLLHDLSWKAGLLIWHIKEPSFIVWKFKLIGKTQSIDVNNIINFTKWSLSLKYKNKNKNNLLCCSPVLVALITFINIFLVKLVVI